MRIPTEQRRARLNAARLLLILTPDRVPGGAVEERLIALLPEIDVLQVRVKRPGARRGPSPARPVLDLAEVALEHAAGLATGRRPLITVDDRVDVAAALAERGLDGVHLGDRDCPPALARQLLGPDLLLGWSTHSAEDVRRAAELPVDYLGFGPVAPTATKGLDRGLGPEAAVAAATQSALPVFAIGGIDPPLARRLRAGTTAARVAVGAAVLEADDPVAAARALRSALTEGG
ncbi:MAG: thiamine phosphate synthase [Planctomycetota bacterium]